ncbi:MAG TPA: hypothetical protein VFO76_06390, partial [Candidatus Kapabacteria bacterium]|nr:hypothetical protein [Candidatus Kapabacteria bacterium]
DLLVLLGRHSEAEEAYSNGFLEAEKAKNSLVLGRIIAGQASIKVYRYDLPAGKESLEKAISVAVSCGDSIGQGMALSALAHVYYLWGLPSLATEYAFDSYKLLKDTSFCTYPLFRLGALISNAGDDEAAKDFLLEGIAATERYNLDTARPAFLGEIGIVYTKLGRLAEARTYYEQGLAAAEEQGEAEPAVNILTLLAYTDINNGDFAAAEEKLRRGILLSKGLRKRLEAWCHHYLAVSAQRQGKFKEAIAILDNFTENNEHDEKAFIEHSFRIHIDCYTELADWKQVASYEKKLREHKDKIDSEQFKSKLTTAQSLIATEREKHDKEIEKMKREQLERELTNTTLQLLAQTEQLSEFREGILAVIRKAPPTEAIAKELREKLKVLPCKSIDWDKFEAQFTAAHPEFRIRLSEAYPGLTKMEIRICTLLRMNLKSQDISQLTCLSERNIENHRYRIRKKMELLKEQDLAQELMKL